MHDRPMPGAPTLDPRQRAFAAAARTAALATTAPSGRPRLVPICFIVGDDALDGRARLYSPLDDKPKLSDDPHDLARVRDILALPEVTLLIDRWSEDWTRLGWLRIHAAAALLEPAGSDGAEHRAAVDALRAKYVQYASHSLEDRPMLRFTVEQVVGWGDLGPD
jgi:PPOX class probable F420-dependent enzyme